jgi:methylornithine synthase
MLERALEEEPLSRKEVLYLLGPKDKEEQERVYEAARRLRDRYFGNRIFLYGFIYFSTWCRNNCTFCYYRTSNTLCDRYRKTEAEIMGAAVHLTESGVHLLDLTMGEDHFYFGQENGFEPLLRLVRDIKIKTGLPVMVSWGVLPDGVVEKLRPAGADWFACYQETHNPDLFQKLRPHQDYRRRFQIKERAKRTGLLIEEGMLSGVGESLEDVVVSMETMKQLNAHQVRVMNFVPQKGTPMSSMASPPPERESIILSVLRLLLPHRLIPASLDVYGIDGLKGKLRAGANVVTSLIPPSSQLRGVAQSTLGICEGYRTAEAVLPILDELGLRKASLDDYLIWMNKEKKNLLQDLCPTIGCSFESVPHWKKTTIG